MAWGEYFGGGISPDNGGRNSVLSKSKKTNMTMMITLWTLMWILTSFNPVWGGVAGILASACIPFANLRWELTVYDRISCLCVTFFSLMSLFGFQERILLPLSYLSFGLMWLLSCVTKIPLSAHYSKNEYHGDKALKSPLFMKTNFILSLSWGILYLITPIWTYIIMGSSAPYLCALVNMICPALLGWFTLWFQKWYPAKIAANI